MKVLLLAPQPFYQPHETLIAVDLLLRGLSELGHDVTLLCFSEGEDRTYEGATLRRCKAPFGIRNLQPGISLSKLICDAPFFRTALRLTRSWKPDIIHAVEEAGFMATTISKRTGVPFIYDMDSSIPMRMAEKNPLWKLPAPLLRAIETRALRTAAAVAPVCPALADRAAQSGSRNIHLLQDISLLDPDIVPPIPLEPPLPASGDPVVMYIGHLEKHAGVDLLLESAARVRKSGTNFQLVLVGGRDKESDQRREQAQSLGIDDQVLFVGPRPVGMLEALCRQADILVSPRIRGITTPMKLYSYLDSGCAVLATDLPTHTQVVTADHVMLAPPRAREFGEALRSLLKAPALRSRLAARARSLVQSDYTWPAYQKNLQRLYASLPHGNRS